MTSNELHLRIKKDGQTNLILQASLLQSQKKK